MRTARHSAWLGGDSVHLLDFVGAHVAPLQEILTGEVPVDMLLCKKDQIDSQRKVSNAEDTHPSFAAACRSSSRPSFSL